MCCRKSASPTFCILQSLDSAFVLLLPGCAGYQLGQRSLYRPDIRTIHVPVVHSDSFRRHLGERLTEAIVKEIELKTTYKVVDAGSADSVLYRAARLREQAGAGREPLSTSRGTSRPISSCR